MELSVQNLYNRWAKIALAILMLLSLFHFETVWAEDDQASKYQEIQKWVKVQNHNKGRLLNPPLGKTPAQVQQIVQMLEQMIDLLVTDTEMTKNIIVHLYSNSVPNAWVHNLTEQTILKKYKDFKHPGTVYEIGVTTGLLSVLQYQDELAFILGHELTHLLEAHTDQHAKDITQRAKAWLSSQSNEVVADLGGLEKMRGKYELNAAITAMLRILNMNVPSNPNISINQLADTVLRAAAGTHHAEGPRISTIQLAIENLRRSDIHSTPRKMKEIPKSLRKYKSNSNDYTQNNLLLSEVKYLLNHDSIISVEDGKMRLTNATNLNELSNLSLDQFNLILDVLETNKASHQKKIDTLLFILIKVNIEGLSGFNIFDYDKVNKKTDTHQKNNLDLITFIRLKKFFLSNSTKWNSELFLENISKQSNMPESELSDWKYELESLLNTDKALSNLFVDLSKSFSQWKLIIEQAYNYNIHTDLDIAGIRKRILHIYSKNSKNKYNNPTLESKFIDAIIKIKPIDFSDIQSTRELGMFVDNLFSPIYYKIYGDNLVKYRKILNPLIQLHKRKIFSELEKNNSNPNEAWKLIHTNFLERDTLLSEAELLRLNRIELSLIKNHPKIIVSNVNDKYLTNLQKILNGSDFTDSDKLLFLNRFFLTYYSSKEMSVFKFADALIKRISPINIYNEIFIAHQESVESAFKSVQIINEKGIRYNQIFKSNLSHEELASVLEGVQSQRAMKNHTIFFLTKLFEFYPNWAEDNLNYENLKTLITRFEVFNSYNKSEKGTSPHLSDHITNILMDLFGKYSSQQGQTLSLNEWIHTYKKIIKMSKPGYLLSEKNLALFRNFLENKKTQMKQGEFERNISKKLLWSILSSEQLVDTYSNIFLKSNNSNLKNYKFLGEKLNDFILKTGLQKERPEVVLLLKQRITERLNIQPQDLKELQFNDQRSMTQKAESVSYEIRGLSALVELVQTQKPNDQIVFIEYLLGRQPQAPAVISELQEFINLELKGRLNIDSLIRKLRSELYVRNPLERAFVINSIFAGSKSLLATESGTETIKNHIIKNIDPKNQDLAKEMLNALIEAEGHNKSFILAYIISQKSEGSEGLSEALVLKSLLDAYGAPGVKLAQYLAFSGSFKAYQPVLEKYQDAAMPITYYDAIQLLQSRMGSEWDGNRYRVNKIIGSGSVNIAIEIEDRITKQPRVVSILREHIEVKTQEDFRRFGLLIKALTKSPELQEKYAFVTGLLDIIKKSVTLEFNKKNSYEMQKMAEKVYNQNLGEWKVRTVQAQQQSDSAVIMKKAIGRSARKVLHENPKVYQQAVSALLQVEYAAMRGVLEPGQTAPKTFFSNPDIHDGQMLIDIETKTVTLLDFGQAITINSSEREFALDILRMINKLESSRNSVQILNKWANSLGATEFKLSNDRMTEVLKKPERMDRFVHLLSELDRAGFDVPLSTIHWVLSANRLIILGEKSGVNIEKSFGHLLVSRKLGLPLEAYNTVRNLKEKIRSEQPVLNSPQIIRCEMLFTK